MMNFAIIGTRNDFQEFSNEGVGILKCPRKERNQNLGLESTAG
jgi:hypothetical protein